MQATMVMARKHALFFSVLICILASASGLTRSQSASAGSPVSFFFDKFPDMTSLVIPAPAPPITIAKVRLGSIAYLRNRHGENPSGIDKLFGAEVEIIEILTGPHAERPTLIVYFGFPGGQHKYPRSRSEREKNHVIAFYRDENGRYQLAGMPVSQKQFEDWDENFWKNEAERARRDTK